MIEKTVVGFYDQSSLQGKCSILISYVFFSTSRILPGLLHLFLFSRTFPGLEIHFSFSRFSSFFRVRGNPEQSVRRSFLARSLE